MTSPATGARPLRIAHLSDLHVLSPLGVVWRRATSCATAVAEAEAA